MTKEKNSTWIKLHSGLLEPKHREEIGQAIWYYLYLCDKCHWATGCAWYITDRIASEDMEASIRTIEKWRQRLADAGYIVCRRGYQCTHIFITKWRDPRLVESEQINVPGQPETFTDDPPFPPSQGSQSTSNRSTPSLKESHNNTPVEAKEEKSKQPTTSKNGKPKPAPKPRPRDVIWEAVLLGSFGIKYTPEVRAALGKSTCARVGRAMKAFTEADPPATLQEVEAYYADYARRNPNISAIRDPEKLRLDFLAYRQRKQGAGQPKSPGYYEELPPA